uniref:LSM domain-containing protein n=1 Tax=Meloidogyne hapla TaxID=6305 RepID=A0A1I8C1J6_MELHA
MSLKDYADSFVGTQVIVEDEYGDLFTGVLRRVDQLEVKLVFAQKVPSVSENNNYICPAQNGVETIKLIANRMAGDPKTRSLHERSLFLIFLRIRQPGIRHNNNTYFNNSSNRWLDSIAATGTDATNLSAYVLNWGAAANNFGNNVITNQVATFVPIPAATLQQFQYAQLQHVQPPIPHQPPPTHTLSRSSSVQPQQQHVQQTNMQVATVHQSQQQHGFQQQQMTSFYAATAAATNLSAYAQPLIQQSPYQPYFIAQNNPAVPPHVTVPPPPTPMTHSIAYDSTHQIPPPELKQHVDKICDDLTPQSYLYNAVFYFEQKDGANASGMIWECSSLQLKYFLIGNGLVANGDRLRTGIVGFLTEFCTDSVSVWPSVKVPIDGEWKMIEEWIHEGKLKLEGEKPNMRLIKL